VEDQIGYLKNGADSSHAQTFHRILGVPESGGVKKPQGQAAPFATHLQDVPSGARDFCNNGPILPGQGIEKGALPSIGTTHYGQANAVPQVLARLGAYMFHVEPFAERLEDRCQVFQIQVDSLVFSIIHHGFGPGHPGGQCEAGFRDPSGLGPGPGLGHSKLGVGFGRDQVPKGLGFQQTLLAIQEGSSGELARFGQAHAQGAQIAQQPPNQERVAVGLELDDVLSGVTVWLWEIQYQGALTKPVPLQDSKCGFSRFG
jgi:hypothetical protein